MERKVEYGGKRRRLNKVGPDLCGFRETMHREICA
jgi:hypothetical protein